MREQDLVISEAIFALIDQYNEGYIARSALLSAIALHAGSPTLARVACTVDEMDDVHMNMFLANHRWYSYDRIHTNAVWGKDSPARPASLLAMDNHSSHWW